MNYPSVSYQRSRGIWGVVLAISAGAIFFAVLVALTGGYFISVLFAAIAMLIVGVLHYLVWGRAMKQSMPRGQSVMPPQAHAETLADEFPVSVNDQDRAALLRLLNQLEGKRREGAGVTPADEAVIRRLRDKLQNYGA